MTTGSEGVADEGQESKASSADGVVQTVPVPGITRLTGRLRQVWNIGCVAFVVQGAGLLVWSWHLWSRFDLTSDFGTFSQAWQQIGTGHLNPHETTFAYYYPHYGYPFWQSHFEIIMWPLGLLHVLWSSTFVLLIVQDVVLAGIGLSGLRFGLELLERQWPISIRRRTLVGVWLLFVLLASPWVYWTASFDFHLQPIAVLLLVMCARDLWNGRRRAWWWAASVLACGDVAASYLIGLGIAAVLSGRATRRHGLYLIGIGVFWVVFVVAIGSGKGSSLAGSYGYLANVTNGTGVGATFTVVWGIAHHPTGVFDVLRTRRDEIVKFIASSGTIGLLSALGVGMSLVVLVLNALNQAPVFIGAAAAFQNLAAVVFLIIGGVTFFTWLVRRGRWGPAAVWFVSGLAAVQVVVVATQWIPKIPNEFLQVNTVTAEQLSEAQSKIPEAAEVIASQGIIGRFGGRQSLYPYLNSFADGQTIPVTSPTVAFVFVPNQGIEAATPAQTHAAIERVKNELGAQEVISTPNVSAFIWHPPPGTRSVRFNP
jgi:Predicted membrane protein (DUF2079)